MADLNVWCSCGRKMGADGIRGRGAYRCGCGAQIRVMEKRDAEPRCVATENAARCRATPVTGEPVPLCLNHRRQLVKVELNGADEAAIAEQLANNVIASWYDLSTEGGVDRAQVLAAIDERRARNAEEQEERLLESERRRADQEKHGVVYFVRMGDKIKIGTTLNLEKRIAGLSLPMSAVLATEQGGPRRERQLHDQFARYRQHGEWFKAAPELLAYIESIKVDVDTVQS